MSNVMTSSEHNLLEATNCLVKNMFYVLDELGLKQSAISIASLDNNGIGISQKNVSNLKNANRSNPTVSTIYYATKGLSKLLNIDLQIDDMFAPDGIKNKVEGRSRFEKTLNDAIKTLVNVKRLTPLEVDKLFDGLDLLSTKDISLTMELLTEAQKNGDVPGALININKLYKAG